MNFKQRITSRQSEIRDDRGVVHRLRLPEASTAAEAASASGQAVWREFRRVARNTENPLYHIVVSGTCLALALVAAIHASSDARHVVAYAFVAVGLMIAGLWNPIWIRKRRDRIARELTGVRECLACTYSIEGLPEDTDGCTVCPECGAAWRKI
jgi:hypothetical protein